MTISLSCFRTRPFLSLSTALLAVQLLAAAPASAQVSPQLDAFLTRVGGPQLLNSNVGKSARAINSICLQLGNVAVPTPASNELSARCGELVFSAIELNDGAPPGSTLGYTDDDSLLAAFQQVNGEEVQAAATFSQNASYEQFSNIAARLGAIRGTTSASVTSVAANGTEMMFGSGGGAAADSPFGPWGWFVRGTYVTGERDPSRTKDFTGAEDGFDFDQYGVTVGIDRLSGSSVWGVALGYTAYDVKMQTGRWGDPNNNNAVNGGSIETDTVSGTFYFDFNSDDAVYFSVLAGYSGQSLEMTRNYVYVSNTPGVDNQTRLLLAKPDGDSIAGSVTLGTTLQKGNWVIDPHLGISYDRLTVDRFAEVDSGNLAGGTSTVSAMQLAFDKQTIKSLRASVGVQFNGNINTSFGSLRPIISLDYYREFESGPRSINVKYALEDALDGGAGDPFVTGFDGCLSCFQLTSDGPDSNFFVVGLGLAAAYQSGLQAFLMFESLLEYDNLTSNAVTLGLRGQF